MTVNGWNIDDEAQLPDQLGGRVGRIKWLGGSGTIAMNAGRSEPQVINLTASGFTISSPAAHAVSPAFHAFSASMAAVQTEIAVPGLAPRAHVVLVPVSLLRRPKCSHCAGTGLRGGRA
jgi:hypothetical protein